MAAAAKAAQQEETSSAGSGSAGTAWKAPRTSEVFYKREFFGPD
jgi:hypothetical protein